MDGVPQEHTAGRDGEPPGRRPATVETVMTLPAPAARRTPRRAPVDLPVAPRGHPGCYWNWERAAWVAWAAVPQPRPSQE